ncbi:MAG: ester cyclase [Gemmatimonadota bacterium]
MSQPMEIAKRWFEAMNRYDLNQMGALCREDAVSDEVAEPTPFEGRDKIVESYRELFAGFPDSRAKILNTFAGQDQVLAEVSWRGTNTGEFRGGAATGKIVDIRIAYIFKIEGGRIRTITEYYDGGAVARQMGLV